jgi:hypothetical protein
MKVVTLCCEHEMRAPRLRAAGPLAGGFLLLSIGCSDPAAARAPAQSVVVPDNPPPSVNPAQLAYDPNLRTLHFYDLVADPKTGRKAKWEVWFPDGTTAFPSGKTFQVRGDVPDTEVLIKASDPPGPPSPGVKLSDIPRKK